MYDFLNDASETKDLASQKLEKAKELEAIWTTWKRTQLESAVGKDH